ncbi:MAG: hypothetical protein F6K58_27995 [Symploca sp. SIO2E9]|nr:hypothetical protein [Symploca sp. SIO2E9]
MKLHRNTKQRARWVLVFIVATTAIYCGLVNSLVNPIMGVATIVVSGIPLITDAYSSRDTTRTLSDLEQKVSSHGDRISNLEKLLNQKPYR